MEYRFSGVALETVLYLLLPLPGLGPGVGTQAVHASAGHQVQEALVIALFRRPRGDRGRLADTLHLTSSC